MIKQLTIIFAGWLGVISVSIGVPLASLWLSSVLFDVTMSLQNYLIVFAFLAFIREVLNVRVGVVK